MVNEPAKIACVRCYRADSPLQDGRLCERTCYGTFLRNKGKAPEGQYTHAQYIRDNPWSKKEGEEDSQEPKMLTKAFLVAGSHSRRLADEIRKQALYVPKNKEYRTRHLIFTGPTGCGKGEAADLYQAWGARRKEPYIKINCASLTTEFAQAMLCGYERGAFTGANESTPGAFVRAHGGTIFLDELSALSLKAQELLLRIIQYGEVRPLGIKREDQVQHVDVQVLAATNIDLLAHCRTGSFREDLYFRFAGRIVVSNLKQRDEEIPHFVRYFLNQVSGGECNLSRDALFALRTYPWPGNIREMMNVIESAFIEANDRVIELCHLPSEVRSAVLGHGTYRE